MPNQAGINFTTQNPQGQYNGKNANNVYNGYRGLLMNPQSSPQDRARAHEMMAKFENTAQHVAGGYKGAINSDKVSDQAKAEAAWKLSNMPKWGQQQQKQGQGGPGAQEWK
ncbi:hypothetical protein JCM5353_007926 [Sporobolomyces roseus]